MATRKTEYGTVVYGDYEPWLDYQFLPGCRECGSPHPLALKPVPADTTICTGCGEPAGTPGPVKTEYAALPMNPAIIYARLCLWVGRKLGSLYERL